MYSVESCSHFLTQASYLIACAESLLPGCFGHCPGGSACLRSHYGSFACLLCRILCCHGSFYGYPSSLLRFASGFRCYVCGYGCRDGGFRYSLLLLCLGYGFGCRFGYRVFRGGF
jgi:hypothetical protein